MRHTYDSATPPCPPTGTVVRLKKSVLFHKISCARLFRSSSSCSTSLSHSRNFTLDHALSLLFFKKIRAIACFPCLTRLSHQGADFQPQVATQFARAQTPPCVVTHVQGCASPSFFVQLNPPFRDEKFSFTEHFVANPATNFAKKNERGIRPKCKKKHENITVLNNQETL